MNHFILYPFWINEAACWSDLKSLNGPVGTENRGVAVFTHRDIRQLNESTFIEMSYRLSYLKNFHFSNLLAASEALMYFWVPDISLSLLSYYLLAGTRILEEKKEYSVELKRT